MCQFLHAVTLFPVAASLLLLVGCNNKGSDSFGSFLLFLNKHQEAIVFKHAPTNRDTNPVITASDLSQVVAGNTAFACDLYKALTKENRNTFFSPYSVSIVFSMTWGGAHGLTGKEIAQTLHFPFEQDKQHTVINAVDLSIKQTTKDGEFDLVIINQLWGERTKSFLPDYITLICRNYGANLQRLDFRNQPESSRVAINSWVSAQTKNHIKDLIPQGGISDSTKLVLTNAVYFKSEWAKPFDAADTRDGQFFLASGATKVAKYMYQRGAFFVIKTNNYQVVALPYKYKATSLLVIMPNREEKKLIEDSLCQIVQKFIDYSHKAETIDLLLPKFRFMTETIELTSTLISLGMQIPFSIERADFSGIDGKKDLSISNVFQKAFVAVDEKGTEAAAATMVSMAEVLSMPSLLPVFTFDHPFIFLILDNKTGTVLFMGKVADPRME